MSIGLLLLILSSGLSMAAEVPSLEIGAKAPDFSLPGIDGKAHSLHDYDDAEILVIIFTCNHCPTAQAYEERIKKLVSDYQPKGVTFVAISPNDPQAVRLDEMGYTDLNDDFESIKIRAKDKGFNFPYLYDGETQEVSHKYGPVATPHVFVFDKDRMLRYRGRVDDSEKPAGIKVQDTRNAIDALLAGKPVPVTTTKTFGCSIKWADKRSGVAQAFEQWAKEPVTLEEKSHADIADIIKNDTPNYILFNAWATWCGPCVAEFPTLVEVNRMYRNRDFQLITLCVDDLKNKEKALAFLQKQQASMTNYIINADDIYKLIEIVDPEWQGAIPHTLLIAPGGEVVYRHNGMITDPLELKKQIVNKLGRVYK